MNVPQYTEHYKTVKHAAEQTAVEPSE